MLNDLTDTLIRNRISFCWKMQSTVGTPSYINTVSRRVLEFIFWYLEILKITGFWLVFLPTFTCLMLHKRHLNIFFSTRFWRPDFQQLRDVTELLLCRGSRRWDSDAAHHLSLSLSPAWWRLRSGWDGTPASRPRSSPHTSPAARRRGCRCAPPRSGTPAPPPPASRWSGRSCDPTRLGTSALEL